MKTIGKIAIKCIPLIIVLCWGMMANAQTTDKVAMHVKGKMNIATGGSQGTRMYIGGHFMASESPEIIQAADVILMGDFINNITNGNVFTKESNGSFLFQGFAPQHILGTADKEKNYINFPKVIINNQTKNNEQNPVIAVAISPDIGMKTKDIDIQRGRLILQSDLDASQKTKVPHLWIDGTVTMPSDNRQRSLKERGVMQVEYMIPPPISAGGKIMGFTPPFHKIYTDYFMYQLVTEPSNDDFFANSSPYFSPKKEMIPGRGYLIGMEVIPIETYKSQMSLAWIGAEADDRIINHIILARDFAPESFTYFIESDGKITDHFTAETPNTTNVQVEIKQGWNYLGNPYTTPIDLKDLISDSPGDWGLNQNDIEKSFHLITDGNATFNNNEEMTNPSSYRFKLTTEVVSGGGSTGDDPSTIIAPMQMFIIKKETTGSKKLTIPTSARTSTAAKFTRSIIENEYTPDNELLLEVKDSENTTYDRALIALRSGASAESRLDEDASKFFNPSRGTSQIYTQATDGKKLVSNILPANTRDVTLYLKPTTSPTQVTLTASRLESLTGVQSVILIDNVGQKQVDLKRDPVYSFTTTPTDREDRFTLSFSGELNPIDDASGISGYYRDGRMEICGLEDNHRGKELYVYDTQGRVQHHIMIQNVPTETIYVSLPQGVYIVKIDEERFSLSAN